jgi:RNA polymerase sigma-32 factor
MISRTSEAYGKAQRRRPLLARVEERALALRYARTGDRRAAHRLIEGQLRLVAKIAHEFKWSGQDIDDLIQAGNEGLVIALEKFDPRRGVKLSTYAAWWIRAYVRSFAVDNLRLVRASASEWRRHGLRPAELSLDGAPEGSQLTRLPADEALRPDLAFEAREYQAVVSEAVARFARGLAGRDRLIFDARFRVETPATLGRLGRRLGVSRERVRQLEKRIVGRLRAYLEDALGEPAEALLAA